eukprot:8368174-Pyramimonas_sp.AAC.1
MMRRKDIHELGKEEQGNEGNAEEGQRRGTVATNKEPHLEIVPIVTLAGWGESAGLSDEAPPPFLTRGQRSIRNTVFEGPKAVQSRQRVCRRGPPQPVRFCILDAPCGAS